MHACAAAGASFLVAVLWFDLMFDVQTRRHAGEVLPAEILASIGGYYRRVTQATPMNRLITVVMGLTVLSIIVEIVSGATPGWVSWTSLAAATSGIGRAATRTVRDAVRLGRAVDPPGVQSRLARSVYGDHLFCLAVMILVVGLQLAAGGPLSA